MQQVIIGKKSQVYSCYTKCILLDYNIICSQGLVHGDFNCKERKFLVQIGDFDSSTTVPGYQLQLEEHQMIKYASVLPLGTMGYRAPEVSKKLHLLCCCCYLMCL